VIVDAVSRERVQIRVKMLRINDYTVADDALGLDAVLNAHRQDAHLLSVRKGV